MTKAPERGAGVASGRTIALLVGVVVLLAINLRTVVASVPPLLETVRDDLGLSATVGGLITTLPVIAFGVMAPLAPRIARRVSPERALAACAVVTAVAAGMRGLGGLAPLLGGNLLAGAAVAVAQGLLPLLIRLRRPERTGLLIGAYAMALNLGAALGSGVSAPLGDALGWRGALSLWALPAVVAAVVWAVRSRGFAAVTSPAPAHGTDAATPAPRRLAWAIALFFGIQSAAFYGGLSWLPTILEADGASASTAGALQGVASVAGIPVALGLPILMARRRTQVPHLLFTVVVATAGILGLLVLPSVPLVWVILLGLGQGGALAIALALPSLRGVTAAQVAELTAFSLLIGYTIGALGPWILGGVHDLTGSWAIPLVVLAAITVLELVPGIRAATAHDD